MAFHGPSFQVLPDILSEEPVARSYSLGMDEQIVMAVVTTRFSPAQNQSLYSAVALRPSQVKSSKGEEARTYTQSPSPLVRLKRLKLDYLDYNLASADASLAPNGCNPSNLIGPEMGSMGCISTNRPLLGLVEKDPCRV
jgi:hypothetical protein